MLGPAPTRRLRRGVAVKVSVDWGHQCRVTGATSRHARLSSTAITSTVAYALCQADSETNTTAFESMPCRTGTTHTGSIIVSRLLRRLPMHVCGFADGTCTYSGIITVCRLLRRIMMNVCRFATGCTRCGAGRYSPGSTVACADCAAGQQHGSAEQSSCWICHAGSVTDTLTGSGAVSCVACVANQYSAVVTFAGRIVCVGLRDRHLERLRCCELHGMHGGSVQSGTTEQSPSGTTEQSPSGTTEITCQSEHGMQGRA
jgi:hypothetical protein